jgi:alpha-tubulin suppressor-like RCC1 family protein
VITVNLVSKMCLKSVNKRGDGIYRDKERGLHIPVPKSPKFPENTTIFAIAAGNNHCVALTDNGTIFT